MVMTTNYVGLACTFHDPAMAVVNSSGQIVFAEATERHLQSKRAQNCPPDNPTYVSQVLQRHCEPGADLVLAKTWSVRALRHIERVRALQMLCSRWIRDDGKWAAASQFTRNMLVSMKSALGQVSEGFRHQLHYEVAFGALQRKFEVRGYDHHLTHAAAACFTSPFDEAVCAVLDGFGEWSSTAFFHYRNGRLRRLRPSDRSLNSLGFFYQALCAACGFNPIEGEEWKVMGLAAYGKFDKRVYEQLKPALRVQGLRILGAKEQYTSPVWRSPSLYAPEDLAYTGQMLFEQCVQELLQNLWGLGLSENLVLGGGCALNSSCNGRILEMTPFRRLHVSSAPGDDGNAVGSALLSYYEDHPDQVPAVDFQSPYLGETMSPETLDRVIRGGALGNVTHLPGGVDREAARLLADGKIIGWVQGCAEFGPRALGNRSILADARQPDIKDRLNKTVKLREPFRPFAPAILHEHGPNYFAAYQESPYMERTLRFRPEVVDRVPGVVHVDGTGRLQTVKREWNEGFHRLLQAFFEFTSVPLLLNTSLNVMGKPIAHSVEDAIAVFASTGLNALVIGDYIFEKPSHH